MNYTETEWNGFCCVQFDFSGRKAIVVKPKEAFCEFLHQEFGLDQKCLPVGMSCGGMHAVYFAAKYPERIAALYLDAPVLNLLSCPAGVGLAGDEMYEEFVRDTGMTKSDLIKVRKRL